MASQKERLRWERWFNDVTARMKRQVDALNRLVLIQTEALAALHEIAAMELDDPYDHYAKTVKARAQEALDRIGAAAAASASAVGELESEDPIEDPRRG